MTGKMADCKQRERRDRCEISRIIARTNVAQGSQYVSLKDKQSEVLMKYGEGDVIAVLPTGYGKTVIIHMLPYGYGASGSGYTINCRLCDRDQPAECHFRGTEAKVSTVCGSRIT